MVSLRELIYHGFYSLLAMVYKCYDIIILFCSLFSIFTGSCVFWRKVVILVHFRDKMRGSP